VQYRWEFLLVVCILTRPKGSSKYGTTRKNTQRYYTTKRLIRYVYVYTVYLLTIMFLDVSYNVLTTVDSRFSRKEKNNY